MADQGLSTYLTEWRKAEDKFYGAALSAPELYTAGVRLVRGIADSLSDVETVEELLAVYPETSIKHIAEVADSLNIVQRDFLDYHLARDAAFYLRHREILETQAKRQMMARIAAADQHDQTWVMLYNTEYERQGTTFFQRLEMHLPDGMGLYSGVELDWEKGRLYVVEPMRLDPASGERLRRDKSLDPRQEFSTLEEMQTALEALRKKYSAEITDPWNGN